MHLVDPSYSIPHCNECGELLEDLTGSLEMRMHSPSGVLMTGVLCQLCWPHALTMHRCELCLEPFYTKRGLRLHLTTSNGLCAPRILF